MLQGLILSQFTLTSLLNYGTLITLTTIVQNKKNTMTTKTSSPLALITILILLLTFIASYFSLQEPAVVTDNNSDKQFSATEAIKRLADILPANNQPHPVNSKANEVVRNNILQQLHSAVEYAATSSQLTS